MFEDSHTAGWLPNIPKPLRHLGQKIAEWFAPKSEVSTIDDAYEIIVPHKSQEKNSEVKVPIHYQFGSARK